MAPDNFNLASSWYLTCLTILCSLTSWLPWCLIDFGNVVALIRHWVTFSWLFCYKYSQKPSGCLCQYLHHTLDNLVWFLKQSSLCEANTFTAHHHSNCGMSCSKFRFSCWFKCFADSNVLLSWIWIMLYKIVVVINAVRPRIACV